MLSWIEEELAELGHKTVNAGELYIGPCSTPENMDAAIREKAAAFARHITG